MSTSRRSVLQLAAAGAAVSALPTLAQAQQKGPSPVRAAFVYVGPVGDAGWTFAHDNARKKTVERFGDKLRTSFVEQVAYGPNAERVIRDLAAQGNHLIFATSFGYMEPMLKVAAEFPNVKFEHATGYKTANNLNVYDSRFYHDTYLAGIIAGSMTKSGTLGFVGSYPIPEVLRNINGFTLGAQSVRPDVKVRVVWVSSWFDPPKESEAAQALINQGADVLLQNTDSSAVLQTAGRNNVYAFGWDSDMSAFAPKAHLASAIVDWTNYYVQQVQAVMDGTWKGNQVTRWGIPEGMNDLIKINEVVPADVRAKVEDVKGRIKARTFEVFTGPIVDNTGKERLPAGQRADDQWKGGVNFFVRGIEGRVPTGR